jgi:hypothetical protein
MNYFRNLAVWCTQGIAVITGIGLNPNETTSGAALRRRSERPRYEKLYRAINRLFFWQKDADGNLNHCETAVKMEVGECVELLAAMGYGIEPPRATIREVTKPKTPMTALKTNTAQSKAQAEEATADDPMSRDFDAEAWFAGLPDNAKMRILEWGVSIKMLRPYNTGRVNQIAQAWNAQGAVVRKNHGMVE